MNFGLFTFLWVLNEVEASVLSSNYRGSEITPVSLSAAVSSDKNTQNTDKWLKLVF